MQCKTQQVKLGVVIDVFSGKGAVNIDSVGLFDYIPKDITQEQLQTAFRAFEVELERLGFQFADLSKYESEKCSDCGEVHSKLQSEKPDFDKADIENFLEKIFAKH